MFQPAINLSNIKIEMFLETPRIVPGEARCEARMLRLGYAITLLS